MINVKVKDFMVKDVISARPSASIKEVMSIFVDKKIGGIPIIDEAGVLRGIVTDGDILRAISPVDRRFHDYFTFMTYVAEENIENRLSELADSEIIRIARTKGIVTVHPEDEMKKVVSILSKHHFKKLPVVNASHHVVGVISRGDVIRSIQDTIINEWQ
ncbi:CBS domain-containing protein [Bacillus sp. sid0103]|uniref:CBS domain-containing protein n=1 Tax=Bacillus sp. sid0103 TaxID=2856337 RepID=UPI001C4577F5|nr:CBS domain-containing protein [Bacillus sp. sid0103]MBV7504599.1 CBS domain-containing protein [Bacillus sp. sid0103]